MVTTFTNPLASILEEYDILSSTNV